jgi:hypothetical protein
MKKILILPLLALFVVSCASSTPAKRIEENPRRYTSLNSRHQALVESGKIENGMTSDAVYLAWGKPASQAEGQEGGKTFEKWTYTSIAPIYSQSFYGGRGYERRYYPYNSFGTEINFVPYRSAWVKFLNGRVDSWQRGRPQ